MSHDRVRLSALVDGELDHEVRDRLLAHLAQCDDCRADVEGERQVKALLSGLPPAGPSDDFTARLLGLAAPTDPLSDAGRPPAHGTDATARHGHVPVRPTRSNGMPGSAAHSGSVMPGSVMTGPAQSGRGRGQPGRAQPGPALPGQVRPYHQPAAWRLPSRSRPGGRSGRSSRPLMVGFAGAASFAGMALVTAFTVGGQVGGPADGTAPTQANIERSADRATASTASTARRPAPSVRLPWSDPSSVTASFGDGQLGNAMFGRR